MKARNWISTASAPPTDPARCQRVPISTTHDSSRDATAGAIHEPKIVLSCLSGRR
jgi:hypothetical protein